MKSCGCSFLTSLMTLWVGPRSWAISFSSKKKNKETISFGPCILVTELHTFSPSPYSLSDKKQRTKPCSSPGWIAAKGSNLLLSILAQLFLVRSITMIRATQKRANLYLLAETRRLWHGCCWLQRCRLSGHVLCQPDSHKVFIAATWPVFRPAVRWCSWEQHPRPP